MSRLTEILKESSLSTTMSSMEIDEVAEEISSDIQQYLDDEIEKLAEMAGKNNEDLENQITDLESKLKMFTKFLPDMKSLTNQMTLEWISKNWELIKKMQENE